MKENKKVSKFERYLYRRIWKEDGIYYFCTYCGDWKHENEFAKDKNKRYGISYTCRNHLNKKNKRVEGQDHLSMGKLIDSDFIGTQILLENLGYKFGPDQLPVWKQFEIKYNLSYVMDINKDYNYVVGQISKMNSVSQLAYIESLILEFEQKHLPYYKTTNLDLNSMVAKLKEKKRYRLRNLS